MTRGSLDIACFEVNGRTYGVDVMGIREIVHDAPVTALPRAPQGIQGVVDLAGRVLPVFDLGAVLDGVAVERDDESRIAVLAHAGNLVGMRVGAAVDVMNVAFDALQAPEAAVGGGAGIVVSLARREGEGPVMVLDLGALLGSVGVREAGEEAEQSCEEVAA